METKRGLLERDDEFDALRAVCADARGGDGAMLALRGPPGIGKTALIDHAGAAPASSVLSS